MATTTAYDESIVQEFADRLYRDAAHGIVICMIVGAALGFVGGMAATALHEALPVLTIVVGGLLGYFVGSHRAFLLRLRAQQALCQVQIERNTRATLAMSRSA